MHSSGQARPLAGAGVLVTRAQDQAGTLVAQLTDLGARVLALPVIATRDPDDWGPLDDALAHLARYRWLVITSQTGARQFLARLRHHGKGPQDLAHLRVAAVGSATAAALERAGCPVALTPASFKGAALPAAMAPHLTPGDRILMARGNLADPGPAQALREKGYMVDDVEAYQTIYAGPDPAPVRSALAAHEIDYVTFTSGSTVHGLLHALGGPAPLQHVRIACIGPETARVARAAGLTVAVQATEATVPGLVAALAADWSTLQTKETRP
jgi:uroporphyrinogen III methyltransferase/synthase